MKYLKSLVLLTLVSCSLTNNKADIERVGYQTSGVEQYFLPELPAWINHSSEGKCFKTNSFHYLDFPKIAVSYQLNYVQLIELQALYNDRLEEYFRSTTSRFLKPVEEASFFSNSMEQVRGGVRKFNIPESVREVDVVWLEGFIKEKKIADLLAMGKSEQFNERLPILFSSCLSKSALNQWIKENGLENVGFYLLSSEWLTPYAGDLKLKPGLQIEITKLISSKIKINIVTPSPKVSTSELVINQGEM